MTRRPDALLLPGGETLRPEHLELAYFAASVVGVEPEKLRLSHLVEHLRRTGSEVPQRRNTDPPAPTRRHGASCLCAICVTRRQQREVRSA